MWGLLFFICLQTGTVYAGDTDRDINIVLTDLERSMSEVKTIQTDFTQEKNLALFDQKIILKGRIFIQKPGFLSWRVFTPLRYSMVMNGSTISQWDEDTNKVQSISLAKNPAFQVVIDQMQNWFGGAYKSMAGDYKITLAKAHPLTLEFMPLESSLSRNFIKRVTVIFQNDERYIKELNIEEKSGDSTVIVFENALLNQPIAANAWEVRSDVR
jgi:outer membrane lipoprotein-sorting protein